MSVRVLSMINSTEANAIKPFDFFPRARAWQVCTNGRGAESENSVLRSLPKAEYTTVEPP
jgi:hypothetical protein